MPKTLQFKRYNTATLASTTGTAGELIVNTDTNTLTVHDGSTAGGTLVASPSKAANWTATQTFTGNTTSSAIKLTNATEAAVINATAISANTTMFLANGSVQYWTSNAGANSNVNITWSGTTTLNTAMAVGDSVSAALLFTNGTTAYYPTSYLIDGSIVTPRWQANTTPTGGNASAIDIYGFTIIKTAAGNPPTYTVLVGQTQFK
jgi:hypothetical protein